jgi:NAD(P)-dependent dehydrogenase (short-subunit alcohol dehydrogenase family)
MGKSSRSVVITGATGDIGRALAAAFAAAGYDRLGLCDLTAPEAAEPVFEPLRRNGVRVIYSHVDVTDAAAVGRFVAEADEAFGGIDACVGNAGVVERGPLLELSPEAWRRTLDVNLTGCFLTTQAAGRAMVRAGTAGHIVLVGSWVQEIPRENIGAYCVSKAGLAMLAKCLALELGPRGVRVNVVAPGFVDAGLTGQNLAANPHRRAGIEAAVPLGRLASADEVARAVTWLCSADARYMTGATLLLDGGSSLFPSAR